jgi:hypothetical protein
MLEKDLIETRKCLTKWGEIAVEEMRNILINAGKSASGNLIDSLKYTITYDGENLDLSFSMLEYGNFVELGRKPGGKQPPLSAITPWLRIRGISESLAFPIARKIAEDGIPPLPFFQATIDKILPQLQQELAIAYSQDQLIIIQSAFKKIK